MIVMKLGGTSLGDARRIGAAADLVRERTDAVPLVVCSAMAGVTSALLAMAREAVEGSLEAALRAARAIEDRHVEAAARLGVSGSAVGGIEGTLGDLIAREAAALRARLTGVRLVGELTPRSMDAIAAGGELLSSALLAAVLGDAASWADVRRVMATDASFGRARPQLRRITDLARRTMAPASWPAGILVTQGFLGRAPGGATTTLGRGGSDLSASLLGAALGVEEIEIWTDVDGMLAADPRIVPHAAPIAELTFAEASELACFGARVLHPATVKPALERGIPVRIRNTFRPWVPGTLLREERQDDPAGARGVAGRTGVVLVQVSRPRVPFRRGYGARVFEAFDRRGVALDLVSASADGMALALDAASPIEGAIAELSRFAAVSVTPGMAVVAVVGRDLGSHPELAARALGALRPGAGTLASMGASERSLTMLVREAEMEACVRSVHDALFGGGPVTGPGPGRC